MVQTFDTEVAVGLTDGYRFIAVKPPLTKEELGELSHSPDINRLLPGVEQIEVEPACTQFKTVIREQRELPHLADRIGGLVSDIRGGGSLQVDPRPVVLQGPNSSPFNPNTDV